MKITNARVKDRAATGAAKLVAFVSTPVDPKKPGPVRAVEIDRPWYWEGHIQRRIVEFLRDTGVVVQSTSDTASREQGKDIVATDRDGKVLWISVKGFPEGSPNVQARHWFAGALLDLALYRTESEHTRLALGFPAGFTTYENLARRTNSTLAFLGCHIFWVDEAGTVRREVAPRSTPSWSD